MLQNSASGGLVTYQLRPSRLRRRQRHRHRRDGAVRRVGERSADFSWVTTQLVDAERCPDERRRHGRDSLVGQASPTPGATDTPTETPMITDTPTPGADGDTGGDGFRTTTATVAPPTTTPTRVATSTSVARPQRRRPRCHHLNATRPENRLELPAASIRLRRGERTDPQRG